MNGSSADSPTPAVAAKNAAHRWKFFRAGGVDQVTLERNSDFAALKELDQKLWVALSCPTRGLEFDAKTLDLMDTDRDGHIRAPEVIAAVEWVVSVLKNPADIVHGSDSLPLDSINAEAEEGRQLLAAARQVLSSLGKPGAAAITLADTTDTALIFAKTKFNGDGVIPPESLDDEAAKAVIADIIGCLGGEMDRSGVLGVTQPKVDQFFAELQAYSDWRKKAEEDAAVLPLGEATAEAHETLKTVRSKVDDYFTRCRLAAFDPRAAAALNRAESEFQALAAKELSPSGGEAAAFPLARIEPDRPLPLLEGVNPAWAAAMAKFYRAVVLPLAAPKTPRLAPEDWARINDKFVPYEAWLASKGGALAEKLGLGRVREILAGGAREILAAAIAQDQAIAQTMNEITAVERLVRYYRDLHTLLRNFVSFRDFYSGRHKAIFQAGTLYLDGRSCDLCVYVEDPAKHAALAGLSETYLAYCDCARKGSVEKMQIAAAFTGGDSDNLMVGRNGVFYDRKGQDWDATITKIIEKPISVWQAILSPYKRIARMIGEQLQKAAAARDQAAQDKAAAAIRAGVAPGQPAPAAPPQPQKPPYDIGKTVGILAAVGLALGFISSAAASIFFGFIKLAWWQMPLAILGVLVVISGASVIMAALKLRKRNLGPILDANGWAVNGRVKINIPFGAALTKTARLPKGSIRMLKDPYAATSRATKITLWLIVIILLAAGVTSYILWRNGTFKRWFAPADAQTEPKPESPKPPSQSAPAPTGAQQRPSPIPGSSPSA